MWKVTSIAKKGKKMNMKGDKGDKDDRARNRFLQERGKEEIIRENMHICTYLCTCILYTFILYSIYSHIGTIYIEYGKQL